jgi:hypothetical protein
MEMLQNLYSAISSPWSAPQKSSQELSSLPVFVQEICPKLIHEIKALPKVPGTVTARVLLPVKLAEFQTNLSKPENALNDDETDKTRRALDKLEHLCRVNLSFLLFHFIPNLC